MSTDPTRLDWVDAARGLCVLAVVLLHFTIFAYLGTVENDDYAHFWADLGTTLTPIRMPMLFFISGFLLSSRVRSGFSSRTRTALVRNYYLYVVWVLVFGVLASWQWNGVPPLWDWQNFALSLVYPKSVLWYIFGLVLWTAVLALCHRIPAWCVLGALVTLSVCVYWLPGADGVDQYLRILKYGFHFAVGVYAKELTRELSVVRPRMVWIALAGAAVVTVGSVLTGVIAMTWQLRLVEIPVEIASIALVVVVFALVSSVVPSIAHFFGWFGRRSMPIYVMHTPVILALSGLPIWRDLVLLPHLTWISPLIWTGVTSVICVGLWALLNRGPGGLFSPPTWLLRVAETGRVNRGGER